MAKLLLLLVLVSLILALSNVEASPRRNVGGHSAFLKIEAEKYDYSTNVNNGSCAELFEFVHIISNSSAIGFYDVDFLNGAELVEMRFNQDGHLGESSVVHFRLDSTTGPEFASMPIQPVDLNYCYFIDMVSMVLTIPSGVHDLYLTFTGNADYGYPDIDWIKFNATAH
ncbi:hypothetical protein CHUAL_006779 [Chamberlinius hualienensis]